jgi:ABC-type nitrate/sulfonate/bicarbonate transport system permease component
VTATSIRSPRAVLARPSQSRAHRGTTALAAVVALALGLAVWQLATWISDGWIPSVGEIFAAMVKVVQTGEFWEGVRITSWRIAQAFVGATAVGFAIGTFMGLNRWAEAFFRPLTVIALAIPDPVYIIFAILILGTAESSGVVALTLAVLPFVVTIVHGAVKARDRQLDDMSRVYRLGRRPYLTHVLARQVAPGLVVAARTAFAFAWKIVVLVEAISQPLGAGAQIYTAFRLLRADELIAVAVLFIVLMRAVDALVFGTLERRLTAWAR